MNVFELTLKGYYGGTDVTDDLILWVAAQSKESIYFAIEEYAEKVQQILQIEELSLDDVEMTLPQDTDHLIATIEERAILYKDKELVALDGDRLVAWSEKTQGYVTLSYGPESIDPRTLSDRERLRMAVYGVQFNSNSELKR